MDEKIAERVLTNGSIYTADKNQTWAEGIAIADGTIMYIGRDDDLDQFISPDTKIIDLNGHFVLPGFIDAHTHPSHGVDYFSNISLYLLDTFEKYRQEITRFVNDHPDKSAFRGSGWSDSLFPKIGPNKQLLDAIVPDKPVALVSYDGHSLWVNSTALQRAGITMETPDPDGGLIERDLETGEPSGTLRETAMGLVEQVMPEYTLEERVSALNDYQDMALRAGITMTHDAMLDDQSIAAFKKLEADGELHMRFRGSITMHPDRPNSEQVEYILAQREQNKHPNFQTNTAKIFVDGVVEGGTAYLLEPYQDRPDFCGVPIWDEEKLKEIILSLDKEKFQIHLHVIGDAAARLSLDALESAKKINGTRDARHMLTHLQLVTPDDILRFKELDLIGIPNPYWFKIDDYYHTLALPYLGKERADRQYPMKSFIDARVVMASASDFPVTIPFDPVIGIELGITRSEVGGSSEEILFPRERASLEEMITSFTWNGAHANFLEDQVGSLEVGKQADLIVLDQNLFEINSSDIATTKVLLTYAAGHEVYRSKGFL